MEPPGEDVPGPPPGKGGTFRDGRLAFKCPAEYDAILTGIYGDWHKFVKGDSLHGGLIVDASRPYPEVIRERFGIDVSPSR